MPYKDPTIQKAAQHKHYVDNKPAYMERTKRRRRDQKQKAIEYLGGKCVKCGYNRNWAVLEFHHSNGVDKDICISDLIHQAWKRIKEELDKCVLLCANCHREEHNPDKFFDAAS